MVRRRTASDAADSTGSASGSRAEIRCHFAKSATSALHRKRTQVGQTPQEAPSKTDLKIHTRTRPSQRMGYRLQLSPLNFHFPEIDGRVGSSTTPVQTESKSSAL